MSMPRSTAPDIPVDEILKRLGRLGDELTGRGSLKTERWREAVLGTARHVFVPGYWVENGDSGWRWVDSSNLADRGAWLDAVYSNTTLVTDLRVQPARGGAPAHHVVTSSSTLPGLVVQMLEDLGAEPGQHVLEIGTGSGYSTALMCHALGEEYVTSVDIDAALVEAARGRLAEHGYRPHLAAADGELGLPGRAPYDHLIATCSVTAIPPVWIEQVHPGGTILTNLRGRLMQGAQVRLTMRADGSASGQFLPGYGSFMALRHDPTAPFDYRVVVDKDPGPVRTRSTTLDAAALLDDRAWGFVAQMHLPDLVVYPIDDAFGPGIEGVTADRSWFRAGVDPARAPGQRRVDQAGPRDIWDVLEAAHHEWELADRPRWERYGLTAAQGRTHFWLDEPSNVIVTRSSAQ
ncbi:methyltransferase domain-containing protein [Pseudonocardia aurantiaca]|uniref:Protein-L-isoaspartate O-methyltransferase n=1 Tax=Pseudonocardia aurantiaca TaxID=75290 RepID=A0ABW4FYA2_9PSEU